MRRSEWRGLLPRRSVALGLTDHAAPSLVFVLAGVVLGPDLLNVISVRVLAQLDPVVSFALAVLGVFIGSGLAATRAHSASTWMTGAAAQGFITWGVVGAAMYGLLRQWGLPSPVEPLTAAMVLGLCSAVSAAVRVPEAGDTRIAASVADFDDLVLVIAGGGAVALLADGESILASLALTVTAGVVIAFAGARLFAHADGGAERSVYVVGSTILLGGSAAYVGTSPLLSGFVAGLVWTGATRPMPSLVDSDLRKLQHPLIVILLLIAGASIQFTLPLVWVAAPLVLSRVTGKLLGSLIIARVLGLPPGLLATFLAPPGILGIALALNIQQVLPTGDTLLVSAVTTATVGAELLAVMLVGSTLPAPEPAGGQA